MSEPTNRPNVSVGGNVGGNVVTGDNNQVDNQPAAAKWWKSILDFFLGFFMKNK